MDAKLISDYEQVCGKKAHEWGSQEVFEFGVYCRIKDKPGIPNLLKNRPMNIKFF